MLAAWGARPAIAAVRQRITTVAHTPAFRIAVIMPMVLIGGIGATAPPLAEQTTGTHAAVIPMAAVMPHTPADATGPAVVTAKRLPGNLHIATGPPSAPQPPLLLSAPGPLGIPTIALSAYRNAEAKMAVSAPGCGVSWNLLAGIGRIESMHANFGATDARGNPMRPIFGPALDGTLPGNEIVVASTTGSQPTYARAMGPMQFLPGTWARYAADGDGDGISDPQNLYDSTLAAAQYLCSGALNLREPSQVMTAVLRYNNSLPYARNVLGWAAGYATGVFPVDLPPLVGPPPPLGDIHLERPEGLGPNLPFNVNGLPFTDPMARLSLSDFDPAALPNQPPQLTWPAPTQAPACTLICIDQQIPQDLPAEDTANNFTPNPVN